MPDLSLLRAQLPTGRDKNVKLRTQAKPLYVTVIEHSSDGVYVGMHPHLCFIPYTDIEEVQ
jgi:hypothetical protein